MSRTRWQVVGWVAVTWTIAVSGHGQAVASQRAAAAPPQLSPSEQRVLLDRYCVTCHNDKMRTGGLALDKLDLAPIQTHADIWEKVVRKLRTGDMPPAGRPRPDPQIYEAFATALEKSLDVAANGAPNPGRPALHRLNRTEYANVIRDLLEVEVDVASLLPPDDSTYGFDNIADVLKVSPLLLEQYLAAARTISRAAIGNPATKPATQTYRAAADLTQDHHLDGMPFGTRGGMLVRHEFPLDAEYLLKVQLKRSVQSGIRGLAEEHDIEILVDGRRIQLFTVGGADSYIAVGDVRTIVPVTKAFTADAGLQVRVALKAGPHWIGAAFVKKTAAASESTSQPFLKSYINPNSVVGQPDVSALGISGPYGASGPGETPSRRRIFTCSPIPSGRETACARTIVSTLARKALRRPVSAADLKVLLPFYESGREEGGFETGIELALRRIMVDPEFVFRVERDPPHMAPGTIHRVSDLELASRLSFFLWSSIPDDELLDLAERGMLKDLRVLDRQVRRMLNDPKSDALVTNFTGQWLYLRNLGRVHPNLAEFPDFDDNLRQSFRRETELFFQSVVREDRSVLDLLNADYTFVNERLARHYGIPNVYGDQFRRVKIVDDNRRGLLGHGSLLTVTSYANRTSPVQRGKWILENVLGAPPPPPPPNVPDLKDNPETRALPMRERMEQHRRNPVCAGCHARMDPLGLALEHFDAVGQWRTVDGARAPIDSTGTLVDGTPFDGPAGLRKALLSHPERFVSTITEKLLTYALGRGLDYYDAPTIRAISRASAEQNYAFSSMIMQVVRSSPFQMRGSAPAAEPAMKVATAAAGR